MTNDYNVYNVSSGNWIMRVALNTALEGDDEYIEAATQAIECVFGSRDLDEMHEMLVLANDDGIDYFTTSCSEAAPRPMFSIVTTVCLDKHKNNYKKYKSELTSVLFANAAQLANLEIAKNIELKEQETVNKFLEFRKNQKKH